MKTKRTIALLLSLIMMLTVVGCSKGKKVDDEVMPEEDSITDNNEESDEVEIVEEVNSAFADAEKKLLDSLSPLPEVSEEYDLAAILITLSNPFWITVKEGYEDAAKEFGVNVDILSASKEDDVNSQLETFKTAIGKDYNAIAISAITPFNLIPGVVEANKKNIPVVAVGTSIDKEKGDEAGAVVEAFVTSDFEEQGRLGAEFIVSKIKEGQVAVIEGMAGAAQGEARKNGAIAGFESGENIEIVSVQAGNWDRKTAYDIATNLIQANPDLKGIFCANDMMALGVVDALKAAGKKDQVVVVGVDFIDEARESMIKGELDGTVAMSPYLFGKGGLILALKTLEGHELTEDIYWSPVELVNQDNVLSFDGWK